MESSEQPAQGETKRYIYFFIIATLVVIYTINIQQQQLEEYQEKLAAWEEQQAKFEAQNTADDVLTTATLSADGSTSGSAVAAIPAPAPVKTREELQAEAVEAWQNAEIVPIYNSKVAIQLSSYGGRIDSWKVIDPRYSVGVKQAADVGEIDLNTIEAGELIPYGDEFIMDYGAKGVPPRPLELTLIANNRSYTKLNEVEWDIDAKKNKQGGWTVKMTSPVIEGLQVVKSLYLPPDSYSASVKVDLKNLSPSNMRFDNSGKGPGFLAWGAGLGDYTPFLDFFDISEVVYRDSDGNERINGKNLPVEEPVGPNFKWGAVFNKYMIGGVLELQVSPIKHVRAKLPQGATFQKKHQLPLMLEAFTEVTTIGPKKQKNFEFEIFAAPKSRQVLANLSVEPGPTPRDRELDRAILHNTWNILRWLCLAMLWLLDFFHGLTNSWGFAIIFLTVSMKLVTHPINHRALRINAEFQREMAKVKPELDELKEKYKEEPMKMMSAQRELFKKHEINQFAPLRGCLPMLLQLPIFIALYRIFGQSTALHGESFYFIKDLSAPDYLFENIIGGFDLHIMPILMLATQVVSMSLSTRKSSMEKSQRYMMMIMPCFMVFLFYGLASGLFLYWVMQNLWQIGHTIITNKEVEHEAEEKEAAIIEQASGKGDGPAPTKTSLSQRRKKK